MMSNTSWLLETDTIHSKSVVFGVTSPKKLSKLKSVKLFDLSLRLMKSSLELSKSLKTKERDKS